MSKPAHSAQPIVFMGSGPVAKASLDALLRHTPVEAVITKPSTLHMMRRGLPQDVPVHIVDTKHKLTDLIRRTPFQSRLGIIVDFGIIVEQAVIDAFPLGILNSHFSLLPQWRGADPITFSILSGQPETGVSLMLINAGLDEGELIAQENLPILPGWTTGDLTKALVALSNDMLERHLPAYFAGKLKPYPQDTSVTPTYSRKFTKEDGKLDWAKPAAVLEREIRAFGDWPKSYTAFGNLEVTITKAHANGKAPGLPGSINFGETGKKLIITCGENSSLVIDELKPAGKKTMPTQAFLAGYKNRLQA